MILHFFDSRRDSSPSGEVSPMVDVFLESQKDFTAPHGFVLQVMHSDLAGQLVRNLLPEVFGPLPSEVAPAAERHDLGWADSDNHQLERRANSAPKPFPAVPEDELPSWRRSLELADTYPPLAWVLIGRHFAALAQHPSPRHEVFLTTEVEPRVRVELLRGWSEQDLARWAAAVGLCDLLSLYLCSGLKESGTFPLAHPAEPESETARRVTLFWKDNEPYFSAPVFQPGTRVHFDVLSSDTLQPKTVDLTLR